jgi:hypothetical protein
MFFFLKNNKITTIFISEITRVKSMKKEFYMATRFIVFGTSVDKG